LPFLHTAAQVHNGRGWVAGTKCAAKLVGQEGAPFATGTTKYHATTSGNACVTSGYRRRWRVQIVYIPCAATSCILSQPDTTLLGNASPGKGPQAETGALRHRVKPRTARRHVLTFRNNPAWWHLPGVIRFLYMPLWVGVVCGWIYTHRTIKLPAWENWLLTSSTHSALSGLGDPVSGHLSISGLQSTFPLEAPIGANES
jgi:hypothetical protein